jgi:phage shock protein A
MNVTQRFSLMMRGSITCLLDSLEDPERSLHQLVLDMEDEVEAAKQAAARAMANEDRLRQRLTMQEKDAAEWQRAAERCLGKGEEAEAKDCLRRAEVAERQCHKLREERATQSAETEDIRESVMRMNERMSQARDRLQLIQAQMRQAEARKAVSKVMNGVERRNLHAEFDRVAGKADDRSAQDRAYRRLDDELSGDDHRKRMQEAELDEAVEERLAAMKTGGEE